MALPVCMSGPVAAARELADRLRWDPTALADLPGFLAGLPEADLAPARAALLELTATIERHDPLRAADVMEARLLPRLAGNPAEPLPDGPTRRGADGIARTWVSGRDPEHEFQRQMASLSGDGPLLLCGMAGTPWLEREWEGREVLVWEPDKAGHDAARAAGVGELLPLDPAEVSPRARPVQAFVHPALRGRARDDALAVAARVRLASPPVAAPTRPTLDVWILDRGRAFHGEDGMAAGMEAAGHRVSRVSARDLDRVLRAGPRPDLVVSVNLAALVTDADAWATVRAADLPVVAWFVDEPLAALSDPDRFAGTRLLALSWEREAVPRLRGWGFAADHLPLGAMPVTLSRPATPTRPISWVASSYAGRDRQDLARGAPSSPGARQLRELAAEALAANPRLSADAAWTALGRIPGAAELLRRREDRIFLRTASADDAAARRRGDLARALAPLGLEIFGDEEGWRTLDTGATLHPVCAGERRHEVYAESRVSLDLVHPQMATAVSLRAFEVPLAGGLLLADDRPDLHQHFDVGREVLAYRDAGHARELAAWALGHPPEAAAIAAAGQRRAHDEHTMVHRARRLVQLAREHRIL